MKYAWLARLYTNKKPGLAKAGALFVAEQTRAIAPDANCMDGQIQFCR
jgi:hypothetical protein